MAISSVLERNSIIEEKKPVYDNNPVSDEEHNARIKKNYAMLINPETKLDELLGRNGEVSAQAEAPARREVVAVKPVLVENARADAAIFRADNPINRRTVTLQPKMVTESDEEEENEDLRPTQTTIQYRTADAKQTYEEGKISNSKKEKRVSLNKKEKIIVAVVVSVIIALFVLLIINSAIISGINNDLNNLQSSLTTVKAAYSGVSEEMSSYLSNKEELAKQFALIQGMIR